MGKHFKADKPNPNQPRHICFMCRKKRYQDRMTRIFDHQLITGKKPIWACTEVGGQHGCNKDAIKLLIGFEDTGVLKLKYENGKNVVNG